MFAFTYKRSILQLAFIWFVSCCYAQNQTLQTIETELKNGNNKSISKQFSHITISSLSAIDVAKFHYLKGKYYESINDDKNAYAHYLNAKKNTLLLTKKN